MHKKMVNFFFNIHKKCSNCNPLRRKFCLWNLFSENKLFGTPNGLHIYKSNIVSLTLKWVSRLKNIHALNWRNDIQTTNEIKIYFKIEDYDKRTPVSNNQDTFESIEKKIKPKRSQATEWNKGQV